MKCHHNHVLRKSPTIMAATSLLVLCSCLSGLGFAQSGTVQIEDSHARATYVNACTIQRTTDDVVFDFAFFASPEELQNQRGAATYRIVTNFYTAKRMSQALAMTIDRHESVFGEVEAASGAVPAVNGRNVEAEYVNFCRITGAPEEMIVDLGLNPKPIGIPTKPIPVSLRIILNFRTAKRLSSALEVTLEEIEAEAGTIETDVQKRVKPQPQLR